MNQKILWWEASDSELSEAISNMPSYTAVVDTNVLLDIKMKFSRLQISLFIFVKEVSN